MNAWKLLVAPLILAVACQAGGCRSGVSAGGKSLSLLVVPMYKQPLGYSSTFAEHLATSAPLVENAGGLAERCECQADPAEIEPCPCGEDEVTFPCPCGPICRQPSLDGIRL